MNEKESDKSPIVIDQYHQEKSGDHVKHSASVDGETVWFTMPLSHSINDRAELFIAAILLQAMFEGRDIKVAAPLKISTLLHQNFARLQNIYCGWVPSLKTINVHIAHEIMEAKQGEATFFSGGVDSFFSLIQNEKTLTHLLHISGFEDYVKPQTGEILLQRWRTIADRVGKKLIYVQHNVRPFTEGRGIAHEFQHGLTLGAIACLVGLSKVYIPSSYTYATLFPWGSHPMTDELWRTESTVTKHQGLETTRVAKTERLLRRPELLPYLQVCWFNPTENCGHCSKCVRTRLVLELNGATTSAFPDMPLYPHLWRLRPYGKGGEHFLQEIIDYCEKRKAKRYVKKLRQVMWWYKMRFHASALVHLLSFNLSKKLLGRVSKAKWREYKVRL